MTFEELILNKLDDLCKRISAMEQELKDHIKSKQTTQQKRKDIILISIAIISSITAIYQTIL